MRIFDHNNKKALSSILIMLTPSEVHEMIGSLKSLNMKNDHVHVPDEMYQREITIGIYTPETIQNFSDEVIQLLQED